MQLTARQLGSTTEGKGCVVLQSRLHPPGLLLCTVLLYSRLGSDLPSIKRRRHVQMTSLGAETHGLVLPRRPPYRPLPSSNTPTERPSFLLVVVYSLKDVISSFIS